MEERKVEEEIKKVSNRTFRTAMQGGLSKDPRKAIDEKHGIELEDGIIYCRTCNNETISYAKHILRHVNSTKHLEIILKRLLRAGVRARPTMMN